VQAVRRFILRVTSALTFSLLILYSGEIFVYLMTTFSSEFVSISLPPLVVVDISLRTAQSLRVWLFV
jgi:hypothetical protein